MTEDISSTTSRSVHPVDIHIGKRIRIIRVRMGLSQSALAQKVGLTFQQIQKYERGANRVSGSRMYEIAGALDVAVTAFFEGLPGREEGHSQPNLLEATLLSNSDARLVDAFSQLPPALQKASYRLINEMSKSLKE